MDSNRQEHQQDTMSGPGERTGYGGAARRRGKRAVRQQVQMQRELEVLRKQLEEAAGSDAKGAGGTEEAAGGGSKCRC